MKGVLCEVEEDPQSQSSLHFGHVKKGKTQDNRVGDDSLQVVKKSEFQALN